MLTQGKQVRHERVSLCPGRSGERNQPNACPTHVPLKIKRSSGRKSDIPLGSRRKQQLAHQHNVCTVVFGGSLE